LQLSSRELAEAIGISVRVVNAIVRRRRAVTAEMALRLSRYLGTTARLWLDLQSQHDIEVARQKMGKKLERLIQPLPRPDLNHGVA
jgi:antitoxin HigA-1